MSGLRSRRKGVRVELAVAKALQAHGIAATKVSRAYQSGHDIVVPVAERLLRVEVKARIGPVISSAVGSQQ
jgi:Holliday junction resolvase